MKKAVAMTAAVLSALVILAETAAENHAYPISPDKCYVTEINAIGRMGDEVCLT